MPEQIYKISSTPPRRRRTFRPSMTFLLIIINAIVFLIITILQAVYPNIYDYVALTPKLIAGGNSLWTLLTSMFVHASFMHLFFNMFSLFFVGSLLERLVGRRRFLGIYLISGLIAGLFFALLSGFFGTGIGALIFGDPTVPGVGASGAIFGLVGVLVILIPRSKVYLIGGPLIAIIAEAILEAMYPTSALVNVISLLITIYLFASIFAVLSFNSRIQRIAFPIKMDFWVLPIISIIPLIIIGLFVTLPIGNTAHLGGFLVGVAYGVYLRNRYKNKTNYLRRIFT